MCETNAYIYKDGAEELFFEGVDVLLPEDGNILIKNMFGEQKVFEGRIREISLMKHKIVLEKK